MTAPAFARDRLVASARSATGLDDLGEGAAQEPRTPARPCSDSSSASPRRSWSVSRR
jgi:hypothetical protein